MKNIDEISLQKIPCLLLTDWIVKLTALSIFLHSYNNHIIKKTISEKRRLKFVAHPNQISLSNESDFSQLKYLSKCKIRHRLLLVHQVNYFHLCIQ